MLRLLRMTPRKVALLGLAGLAISGFTARGESPCSTLPAGSPLVAVPSSGPGCATPLPSMPGFPTTPPPSMPAAASDDASAVCACAAPTTPPAQQEPVQPQTEGAAAPMAEPSLGEAGAQQGGDVGIAAPNMIGDLLYSSRSIQYGFGRITGNSATFGLGSTSIVNASVAENNSPIPQDRVYFRYNLFTNSQSITGISPQFSEVPPGSGVFIFGNQTKQYNTSLYTLGGEKTFFDGLMSVEVRLPIVSTLSTSNNISVGNITGPVGGADPNGNPFFGVQGTPGNTLGQEATYFDNMSVILKSLLYKSCNAKFALSGGMGIGIPTAPDTRLSVVDYAGTGGPGSQTASGQEVRQFTISNDTWALSPFLAFLYLPAPRFFTQGFFQVEVPLNSSTITYSDHYSIGSFGTGGDPRLLSLISTGQSLLPPFTVRRSIDEQTLAHVDLVAGYWLVQNPDSRWLNGMALSFETHYTGALTNADRVQLPGNGTQLQYPPSNPIAGIVNNGVGQVPNIGPVVVAGPSRVDIVDVTVGTTFLLGNQSTLATAFTVPVTTGANKTFDWEFQVQLNFYFGAIRNPFAPNAY